MIRLTAREALSDTVGRVTATMRPQEVMSGRGARVYAVFDEEERFLGLVTGQACVPFSGRIFADLLPKSLPQPVVADTPIETIYQRMVSERVEGLPVLDEQGGFLGAITHPSLLEALLRRERELLAEACRLQGQLQTEQQRLAARSRRFEELLRTTEKRLKHLVSSTPAVIYTCEPSPPYGATFISENVKQQLGYDPREFVEDPRFWADHIHPEDAPGILTNLSQLFTRDRHIHEYRFRHQDGTYRWMRDELKLVRNAQGRPLEIVGYWSDITERRQAEGALQESELWLRSIFASLEEAVFVVTSDRRVVNMNGAAQRMLGYRLEELKDGSTERLHLDHDHYVEFGKRIADAFRRDEAARFEFKLKRKNGEVFPTEHTVSLLKRVTGEPLGIVSVVQDITHRKRAEEALRESEQKHRTVLENIDEIVYAVRTTEDEQFGGTVQFVSGRVGTILGYEPDEFFNDPSLWFRLVHPDDVPALRESTHNVFATKQGGTRVYRLRPREAGEYRWMEDRVVPRLDTAGNVIGLLGVARDISQRTQAEEALREMNVALSNAMPGISRLDPEGRYVNVNEIYAHMLGYEPDEMIGVNWKPMVYADDRRNAITVYERMVRDGKAEFEARAVRKDGSVFDKHALMVRIVSKGGDFAGHHCFMRDITERKRAEVALRESEERQAAILRTVPVVLYCAATTGDLPAKWMSENAQSLTGFPAERFLANPDFWASRLHPEDRTRVLQTFAGIIGGGPVAVEYRWQDAEGTFRWFLDQVVFIRRSEGQPAEFIGTRLDITTRKQAEQALLAHTFQIEAVRAVSTEITRELDLSGLLGLISRRAAELVDAPSAGVYLWEEATQTLALQAWYGDGEYVGEVRLRLGEGVVGTAAQRREGLIVNDYRNSPDALPIFVEHGITAVLAEPLLYGDRLVGVIVVGSKESGRAFTEQSREILVLLAAQAAVAIENARLHKMTVKRAKQLATLTDVTRMLTMVLDPQAVAREILAAVQILIPEAACRLWEQVSDGDALHLVASIGLREPEGGDRLRLARGEGLAGMSAATRQPIISPDVTSDPRFANQAWAATEGLVACVVLPLIYGERVHGALLIFTREPHTFTDEEVSLLRSFADQAAIAIENARLFDQVRTGRERLQTLSRRLVEVQETERRHIARELHDEIGQVLTAVKINLQAMQRLTEGDPLVLHLGESIGIVERGIEQVRNLSLNLHPSILDDLGLVAALRWQVDRLALRAGLVGQFLADPLAMRPPQDIETVCFRVAQEALTNVVRHAQARRMSVELRQREAHLELLVQDDGVGFDVGAAQRRAARGASFGLLGLQERVHLVGGQVAIESTPSGGTTIRARFPLTSRMERRGQRRD